MIEPSAPLAPPAPPPQADAKFRCPECGMEFDRAQGLGIHRRSAHGVEGTAESSKRARAKSHAKPARRGRPPKQAAPLDRGALLALIYPGGLIPADQLDRIDAWLGEAASLRADLPTGK